MNYLAIFESELIDRNHARLVSTRARYAIEVHELKAGLSFSVVVINQGRKKAQVLNISTNEINLLLSEDVDVLPQEPIELIVAIPRPQTLRKVLQLSATFGIKALHLIRSENVVKSYLTSKRLEPQAIEEDLLLGIEQSGSTCLPEVFIHHRFQQFVEDYLPLMMKSYNDFKAVVADTHKNADISLNEINFPNPERGVFIAIGPESGWNQYEVEKFQVLSFSIISLGKRILRVETACTALISQIQLLKN